MSLETATYINSLVETWPDGSTDTVSQGDDHIRVLKASIKRTFPNIAAEVSVSAAEVNFLDGITDWVVVGRTGGAVKDVSLSTSIFAVTATTIKKLTQSFIIESTNPSLRWYETDGGTNEKYWAWESNSGTLKLVTKTDALASGADILSFSRSGTALGTMTFHAASGVSIAMSSSGALTFTNGTVTGFISYSVTPTFQFGTTSAHNIDLAVNGTTRITIRTDDTFTQRTTTVASLPAAVAGLTGARAFVTDATATTFASVAAGGGSNKVPVYCDGSNWRIG